MRINLLNCVKYPTMALFMAGTLNTVVPSFAQTKQQTQKLVKTPNKDIFVSGVKFVENPVNKYTQEDLPAVFRETVNPSSWTIDPAILKKAPSPMFKLQGKTTQAKIVVNVTDCRLYIYDESGKVKESFKTANGASSTPTPTGISKVLGKQTYPYRNCPRKSKRYRFPRDYGPRLAYLNVVDTITGELSDRGRYLHGTKHERALMRENRHVTHSCTRVHNRDALYIINDVLKIGDYIKYVK
jgi:lipoprotein-anchoring transpeptidase ErfK/SrfK